MTAYAYRRKSRVFRDQNSVSPEMQLDEIRALAQRLGDKDLVVLEDMNISGKKGRAGRPGFNTLLESIEAGIVTAVYSYSLSRLSRSVRDIVDLADLCAKHKVPIHLVVDQDPDPTTASGKMVLNLLSAMAQFEADVASERAKDTAEARRSRGEKLGPGFYANTEAVTAAYDEAGSILGAARLLTLRGVPTQHGKSLWQPTVVRTIIERVAPEMLPARPTRGVKRAAPFLFYRLLRCHCGKTLTGVRQLTGTQAGYVSYRCLMGRTDPFHGRQSLPETAILSWAMAEAALMSPPDVDVNMAEDAAEKKNALRDRMNRLGRAFTDGLVPELEYESERAGLQSAMAELDAQGRAVTLEPVSWDREPADVNQALRALWSHVQLTDEMRPAFAAWALPAWRREETPAAELAPGLPAAQAA